MPPRSAGPGFFGRTSKVGVLALLALGCDTIVGLSSESARVGEAAPAAATSREPKPLPSGLPESVLIRASQSAWKYREASHTLTRTPQGYVEGERTLDAALVESLLRAVASPLEPALNAERFRPFVGDLRAGAERLKLPPRTAQHLAERALLPEHLDAILRSYYATRVHDDYPKVVVELTWPGGHRLTLESVDQHEFMLPWAIDGSHTTWNPDISLAIAALAPERFMHERRITGEGLASTIAWHGNRELRAELGALEAEERFGGKLGPLERRFRIERAAVVNEHRFNLRAGDQAWCGKLFPKSGARFGFSLCLSAEGALPSLEPFLRDADGLLARAGQVPWLSRFAAENPDAKILIEYLDDAPLGAYARNIIPYDLRGLHAKPELADLIEKEIAGSIGITIEHGAKSAAWLVLPDGRALFRDGTPFGAAQPKLPSSTLIHADGSSDWAPAPKSRASSLENDKEFEERARAIQDSVSSGFRRAQEGLRDKTLSEEDKQKLSGPFDKGAR